MSRIHYGHLTCRICGERRSTNGLGKHAHNMKHVRQGLLVKMETPAGVAFTSPEKAQELLGYGMGYAVLATAATEAAKRTQASR